MATTDSSAPAHPSTEEEAPHGCPLCFGGYVTITVEEDGQEHDEAVPCRRCQPRLDSR
jgi:hypothetical protein